MSEFFKTSIAWVIDFRYDGQPRRWIRLLRPGQDAHALMAAELQALHGKRAQLVQVRLATADEERAHLRGEVPPQAMCPTGRQPRPAPEAWGSAPGAPPRPPGSEPEGQSD